MPFTLGRILEATAPRTPEIPVPIDETGPVTRVTVLSGVANESEIASLMRIIRYDKSDQEPQSFRSRKRGSFCRWDHALTSNPVTFLRFTHYVISPIKPKSRLEKLLPKKHIPYITKEKKQKSTHHPQRATKKPHLHRECHRLRSNRACDSAVTAQCWPRWPDSARWSAAAGSAWPQTAPRSTGTPATGNAR